MVNYLIKGISVGWETLNEMFKGGMYKTQDNLINMYLTILKKTFSFFLHLFKDMYEI